MTKKFYQRFPRAIWAVLTLSMYLQIMLFFGLSITWGAYVFAWAYALFPHLPQALQTGVAGGITFVGMTLGLAALVIIFCRGLLLKAKAGRYHPTSLGGIRWATYNFYILLFRYTLMNFIRATQIQAWFYRLLGATIGNGVQINTNIIADCSLLTIGNYSMIGGEATVVCHSYERGVLVVQPVTIGHYVDIGLNAVIMPGVTIGDYAVVAAGAIVPKNTTIPANTVWAGVPAKQIRERSKQPHALA